MQGFESDFLWKFVSDVAKNSRTQEADLVRHVEWISRNKYDAIKNLALLVKF